MGEIVFLREELENDYLIPSAQSQSHIHSSKITNGLSKHLYLYVYKLITENKGIRNSRENSRGPMEEAGEGKWKEVMMCLYFNFLKTVKIRQGSMLASHSLN